jgi:hypothetical protein
MGASWKLIRPEKTKPLKGLTEMATVKGTLQTNRELALCSAGSAVLAFFFLFVSPSVFLVARPRTGGLTPVYLFLLVRASTGLEQGGRNVIAAFLFLFFSFFSFFFFVFWQLVSFLRCVFVAKGLYVHKAVRPDLLSFQVGDVLTILDQVKNCFFFFLFLFFFCFFFINLLFPFPRAIRTGGALSSMENRV